MVEFTPSATASSRLATSLTWSGELKWSSKWHLRITLISLVISYRRDATIYRMSTVTDSQ
jgi:hypothetical protein